MPTRHVVQQGESLRSIARRYGFADCQAIQRHPENAALCRSRSNPDILHPGDEVFIPDKEVKWATVATRRKQQFSLRSSTSDALRLRLLDPMGEPFAGGRYELRVGDQVYEGTAGPSGEIEHPLPAGVGEASLRVWISGVEFEIFCCNLTINHLDPVEELSGVQARLRALALYEGGIDGVASDALRLAVERFQAMHGLSISGEVDGETREKLREVYGC